MDNIDTHLDSIPYLEPIKEESKICAYDGETLCVETIIDESGIPQIKPRGEIWTVAANYSSKSKLIKGDILTRYPSKEIGSGAYYKMKIKARHAFQDGVVQTIETSHSEVVTVLSEGVTYHVNPASVSFYQLEHGDRVSITVPVDSDGRPKESRFCAIEYKIGEVKDTGEYKDLL